MIDTKDITHARTTTKRLIASGIISKPAAGEAEFFLDKADQALTTAELLIRISSDIKIKRSLSLPDDFESHVWIINASYYSMFYAATALLAFHNHKIKSEQSIHALTYNALIYYFLDDDKKIEKHILERYEQAQKEASELLAKQEAESHVEKVRFEMDKRKTFTYNMGVSAEQSKANTSFERAKEFLTLVKEMMAKKR
jgi:uncharacterized protein (UPF0332 family)